MPTDEALVLSPYLGNMDSGYGQGGYLTVTAGTTNTQVTTGVSWNQPTQDLDFAFGEEVITGKKKKTQGIHPILYFKYIKSQFKPLERVKLNKRLRLLEKAFDEAVTNGQMVLAEKFMRDFVVKVREAQMAAKGVKYYIDHATLFKYKKQIREGWISDTLLKDFTRVIPKKVLKKMEQVRPVFDDFVIFHYWNESKVKPNQRMSDEEKQKMRDPVLFGIIKETDRLYFVADWSDEFCDLSFDEITEVVAKKKV